MPPAVLAASARRKARAARAPREPRSATDGGGINELTADHVDGTESQATAGTLLSLA